jgi:hypothetical protein
MREPRETRGPSIQVGIVAVDTGASKPWCLYVHLRKIIIIHLLGLAPAGCLTAPDNGVWRIIITFTWSGPRGVAGYTEAPCSVTPSLTA